MSPPSRARAVRIPLEGSVTAAEAGLLLRGDDRPVALTGAWAGGGALAASEPVCAAAPDDDPFALLGSQPELEVDVAGEWRDALCGGWFGFLGYRLGARIERIPQGPPRPTPLPPFSLAFYDHLLRLDARGQWWFEALWSDERDAALRARLHELRGRLAAGSTRRAYELGDFAVSRPGAAGHTAAIEDCRERIAAGEIFQANLCLRVDAPFEGDPLDVFAAAAAALEPRYGACVGGPWGAVCSLSPELFLRRRGRRVVSEPIKGTAPLTEEGRTALAASGKDRAENVMIVDLMRNDLGRVCEYGSVAAAALMEPRPGPGVWHLVSKVEGTLGDGAGDPELLRASFPPGSVTGAPKIRAMRVIAELEATGREAYTGAIGFAGPLAGLELNVAIRTLELSRRRAWLGAGGGIVAESEPERELAECLLKARPVIEAAGSRLAPPDRPLATIQRGRRGPPAALAGGAERPDPSLGVFTTLLVRDGEARHAALHVERLRGSTAQLYDQEPSADLAGRLEAAAAGAGRLARLRVIVTPGSGKAALAAVEVSRLDALPSPVPERLSPVVLPGGLGAHKWRDRRLLDELCRRTGATPLLVDGDGHVLEAGYANVAIVEGGMLVLPPLDGRALPGTVRASASEAARAAGIEVVEEAVPLVRLLAADELLLTSSLRGVHPGFVGDAGRAGFAVGARLRAALEPEPLAAQAR
jgi:para-aminobenzoate synthetase/4-amino-4-deoxychorismate lyase